MWKRCSPIHCVADATTPCLLLHGAGREPESRASQAFYNALRQHYKLAEYKVYDAPDPECYYVMSAPGLLAMYEDMAEFFARFLLPAAGAAALQNDAGTVHVRQPRVLTAAEREHPRFEVILGRVAHL